MAGCGEPQLTTSSTSLRKPSNTSILSAPQAMSDWARLVSDKFGSSLAFLDAGIQRGTATRNNPERVAMCRALEAETRTAAGLDAITIDELADLYVCAGVLG